MFLANGLISELGCRPVLPTPAQSLIKLGDEKLDTVGGLPNPLKAVLNVFSHIHISMVPICNRYVYIQTYT